MWVGGIFVIWPKNHNILLSKLESYGITGRDYSLINSYLNDRNQWVLIKNKYSKKYYLEWEKLKKGLPQGSIQGPLSLLL
jgi:hypothetical protein